MRKYLTLIVIVSSLLTIQQKTLGQITPDTAINKRKTGDPFAVLPSNVERLTYFGERAGYFTG